MNKLHIKDGSVRFFVPADEDEIGPKEEDNQDHGTGIGQPIREEDRDPN